MTSDAADSTLNARQRLLEAGKTLFSRLGFERTSTAVIAREAGTSESQLVRYYRTKAGLLEAIFNGTFRTDLSDDGVAAALLGAAEAMVRERLLAQRAGRPAPYTNEEIRAIFLALLRGLQS